MEIAHCNGCGMLSMVEGGYCVNCRRGLQRKAMVRAAGLTDVDGYTYPEPEAFPLNDETEKDGDTVVSSGGGQGNAIYCNMCGSSAVEYVGAAYDDEEYIGDNFVCNECGSSWNEPSDAGWFPLIG